MPRAWTCMVILAVSVATIGTVGCESTPAKPQSRQPVFAQLPECKVGDVCIFRPPRKSTLAFSNLRAYTKFRRLEAAHNPDPYSSFKFFDDGKGWFDGKGGPGATGKEKGDLVALPAVTQIRIIKIGKDGGAEAEVVRDDYHPAPDGVGYVGVKLAGRKVWLVDAAQWVSAP